MSKETELSDEQIDCCVGNLGMAENSILAGPDEIRRAMRAAIAADRELRRGDAGMPPLPEPWQGFQFNPGWNTWENVIRGAINEPRVMQAFTADQMREYAQAALAAKDAGIETLRLQLAACGVAALQNTVNSAANRVTADNPYYSASYGDVCRAVDREIEHRDRVTALTAERDEMKLDYGRACKTIADMHMAATGGITGPVLGVVEDIAALKTERDALKAFANQMARQQGEPYFAKLAIAAIAKEMAK